MDRTKGVESKFSISTVNYYLDDRPISFKYFTAQKDFVYEVLKGEVYQPVRFLRPPARTIVDIGASIGDSVVALRTAYPGSHIYAFEPGTTSFALLSENTATLPDLEIFNFGLLDRDVTLQLYHGQRSHMTDSVSRSYLNSGDSEQIELRDALTTLKGLGIESIDVLKVDTEGCELPILKRLLGTWSPRVIYLEYHSDEDRRAIDALLSDYAIHGGRIAMTHRGEYCYVAKAAYNAVFPYEALAIEPPEE